MKLVFTVLIACLISTGAFAQQKLFYRVGNGECDMDCGVAALNIENAIEAAVNEECAPNVANRESDWEVQVHGYGRLTVSAIFSCVAN